MRYRVRHETTYAYAQPVDLGRHMLHLLPRPLPGQRVVSASLSADPVPTTLAEGVDHFGNRVSWMALDRPHAAFRLALEAVVEVGFAAPPAVEATPGWEQVAAAAMAGGPAGWEAADLIAAEHAAFAAAVLDGAKVLVDGAAGRRALEAALRVEQAASS